MADNVLYGADNDALLLYGVPLYDVLLLYDEDNSVLLCGVLPLYDEDNGVLLYDVLLLYDEDNDVLLYDEDNGVPLYGVLLLCDAGNVLPYDEADRNAGVGEEDNDVLLCGAVDNGAPLYDDEEEDNDGVVEAEGNDVLLCDGDVVVVVVGVVYGVRAWGNARDVRVRNVLSGGHGREPPMRKIRIQRSAEKKNTILLKLLELK